MQTQALTLQEVFDKVVSHLRTQGKKSMNEDSECLYRGPGGLKCAAGCLIEDEEYRKDFEGSIIGSLCLDKRQFLSSFIERIIGGDDNLDNISSHELYCLNLSLVQALQYIHDRSPVEDWEECFSSLAKGYNLSYSPPG